MQILSLDYKSIICPGRRSLFLLLFFLLQAGYAVYSPAEAENDSAASFTNQDLEAYKKDSQSSSGRQDPVPSKTVDSDSGIQSSKAAREQQEQDYWCRRTSSVNRRIEDARSEIRDIEARIVKNDVTAGYRNYQSNKTNLEHRLAAAQKRLKKHEEVLSSIGDEAHRKGIPAGWLRCQFE